ncbi:hypothetical protein HPB47_002435 [Ixodes persulcatus]|uniref:Uncharacterized protein n=1 Tax=Ixodes persulcatus TaxID=34615 RepID=A0AC60PLK7_IXOPE|nr:hypothetical protein HPB47_002435 [Ixodes persulcatus]
MANKKEESSLTSFGQRLVSSERQAKRTGGAAARAPTVECMDPSFCPKVLQGLHNGIIRTWDSFLRNRESKVMVIYTGGTIGMAKDVHGGK